jgi:hypothetical protein
VPGHFCDAHASKSHDLVVLGSGRTNEPHRLTDLVIKDAACPVVVCRPITSAATPRRP